MREPEDNLMLADEAKREMLSYPRALGDEIEHYLLALAANPFSPELLKDCVLYEKASYYHQLPSGCFVFWQIVLPEKPARFGELEGVMVRVTGARFDFGVK